MQQTTQRLISHRAPNAARSPAAARQGGRLPIGTSISPTESVASPAALFCNRTCARHDQRLVPPTGVGSGSLAQSPPLAMPPAPDLKQHADDERLTGRQLRGVQLGRLPIAPRIHTRIQQARGASRGCSRQCCGRGGEFGVARPALAEALNRQRHRLRVQHRRERVPLHHPADDARVEEG